VWAYNQNLVEKKAGWKILERSKSQPPQLREKCRMKLLQDLDDVLTSRKYLRLSNVRAVWSIQRERSMTFSNFSVAFADRNLGSATIGVTKVGIKMNFSSVLVNTTSSYNSSPFNTEIAPT